MYDQRTHNNGRHRADDREYKYEQPPSGIYTLFLFVNRFCWKWTHGNGLVLMGKCWGMAPGRFRKQIRKCQKLAERDAKEIPE